MSPIIGRAQVDRILAIAALAFGLAELALLGLGRSGAELFFDAEAFRHGHQEELAGGLLSAVGRWLELGLLGSVGALVLRRLGRRRERRRRIPALAAAAAIWLLLISGWAARHGIGFELRRPELAPKQVAALLEGEQSAAAVTRALALRHGIPLEDPHRWQVSGSPTAVRLRQDGSLVVSGTLLRPRRLNASPLAILGTDGEPRPSPAALPALFEVRTAMPLADGSSVLLGRSRFPQPVEPLRPYLLAADGTLDLAFTDRLGGLFERLERLARDAEGRFLAAGIDPSGTHVLRRFAADGRPDRAFSPTPLPGRAAGIVRASDTTLLIWGSLNRGGWVRRAAPAGGFEAATDLPPGAHAKLLAAMPGGGFTVLRGERAPTLERYLSVGAAAPELVLPQAFPGRVSHLSATPRGEIWGYGVADSAGPAGDLAIPAGACYLLRRDRGGLLLGVTRLPGRAVVYASAALPDGRILAAATLGGGRAALLRLSAAGHLQHSSPELTMARIYDLELAGDGRILLAGRQEPPPMEVAHGVVFPPAGGFQLLDREEAAPPPRPKASGPPMFGRPGKPIPELVFSQPTPAADGRTFAKATVKENRRSFPVRFSADGELDESFARRADQAFERLGRGVAWLRPLTDGALLVGLAPGRGGAIAEALVRLRPDGRLDRAFTPPNGNIESLHDLAPAPDGTLWLAGRFHLGGQPYGLFHLDPEGRLSAAALGPGHPPVLPGSGPGSG